MAKSASRKAVSPSKLALVEAFALIPIIDSFSRNPESSTVLRLDSLIALIQYLDRIRFCLIPRFA